MEVVRATHSPGGSGAPGGPFQRHDVQEWQRLDRLTGVLETARRESGCWKSDQQQYGKVVDSSSLVSADGSAAQRQLRQLEVFQSRSSGASLQVIRAHTHTSTSNTNNSTRWRTQPPAPADTEFENLQLALNPLDLSSQKTKASVGRSGSIGGRRPPSRPRSISSFSSSVSSDLEVASRLQKVSRLCQQLHEDAITSNDLEYDPKKRVSSISSIKDKIEDDYLKKPSILERQNGDGSVEECFEGLPRRSSIGKVISSNLDAPRRNETSQNSLESISHTQSSSKLNKLNNIDWGSSIKSSNPGRKVESSYLDTTKRLESSESIRNGNSSSKLDNIDTLEDYRSSFTRSSNSNIGRNHISSDINNINTHESSNGQLSNKINLEDWKSSFTKLRSSNLDTLRTLESSNRKLVSSEPITNKQSLPKLDKLNINNLDKIEDWRSSSTKLNSSDLDTGRRLNTALRNTNVDLEALDQILKSISSHTSYSQEDLKEPDKESSKLKKRHSFITAESLQEVRGRLKRLSSPVEEYNIVSSKEDPEPDDGIAEDTSNMKKEDTIQANGVSRVRSYVYGMEAMLHNKKPIIDTGSLESRTSNKSNGLSSNRNEDWYNRRKSYGFEQVHNQQDQTNSISSRSKSKIESSTDSGICRSTEIVVVPSIFKEDNKNSKVSSYNKSNSTVINLNGDSTKNSTSISEYSNTNKDNELFNIWNRRSISSQEDQNIKKDIEKTTITIPIISEVEDSSKSPRRSIGIYHRQISDGTSVSVEKNWPNTEAKRHSIAVDESKYVENKLSFPTRRTSLAVEESSWDLDEDFGNNLGKKQKKVEFCKTEVHFAAESGRVNIVETDEKPPPTQNFRRRRRSNISSEEYNKNGLPIIHFGDDYGGKKPFGTDTEGQNGLNSSTGSNDANGQTEERSSCTLLQPDFNSNVTVVTGNSICEDLKENIDNENLPRGILKNKMIKPRPYILGDDNNELMLQNSSNEEENTIWGVRLRPVTKEETPQIWRSTVTVQNTSYLPPISPPENEETKPEFQKLLNSLRPARKSESSISPEDLNSSSPLDLRRSSWSVADRVKQVEDMKTEVKGYSTRVNFGSGEATVVENGAKKEEILTWPRKEESTKDENIIQNLVVRIGRENSNHTVCSKTTTNHCQTTTTTKITIDLSSPTRKLSYPIKLPRASLHSLKSTSLIMNTFNNANNSAVNPAIDFANNSAVNSTINPANISPDKILSEAIPDQLAALKKLYEEAAEHSDDDSQLADEEVRSYMSANDVNSDLSEDDEISSVISGSWSKMKAFKNIKQHLDSIKSDPKKNKETEMFQNIINRNPKKDFSSNKTSSLQHSQKKSEPLLTTIYDKKASSEAKITSVSVRTDKQTTTPLESPQTDRKKISYLKKIDIGKNSFNNGHLSSPFLVGNSIQKSSSGLKKESVIEETKKSAFNKVTSKIESPKSQKKTLTKKLSDSPKITRKIMEKSSNSNNWKENKPDLLQFSDSRQYENLIIEKKKAEAPIYENIDDVINSLQEMEKESSMLQELTKAADQILQAVNGYTDEDSKLSEESEEENKKHRMNLKKADNLTTISETKSWKQTQTQNMQTSKLLTSKMQTSKMLTSKLQTSKMQTSKSPKGRVKPTSSTSSIESLKEAKPIPPVRMNRAVKLNEAKKKAPNPEVSRATRARRLQRASSREALLQSHGSSSEDIASTEIRKPRLVRRTKTQNEKYEESVKKASQSTTRRTQSELRKNSERISVVGLQEIRHKTAISTIKSTAEKNASREKALKAKEDLKKRTAFKSTSSSKGLLPSSSVSRPTVQSSSMSRGSSNGGSFAMKKINKFEGVTKY